MSQSEDRTYVRHFSGIIIGLVLVTVVIVFLARSMQNEPDANANPSQRALAEHRISPVSRVRVGDEGAAALAEAQAASAAGTDAGVGDADAAVPVESKATNAGVGEEGAAVLAVAQTAADPDSTDVATSDVDGEQAYSGLCQACHEAGVAGAPITGSEQMAQRLSEKGLDTLVDNAINGINVMPPRGGNPALTDEQIRAAVVFMLP